MSIIAVQGFPMKFSLMDVVKALARPIHGHFEALNFNTPKNTGGKFFKNKSAQKTCYLRLSEKLDPVRIVERIDDYFKQIKKPYRAHIPKNVPDIPLGAKPKTLPLKTRMALRIPDEDPADQVLQLTTDEILIELQSKFPGVYCLSKKTGHKLLIEISKKIFNRLKDISESAPEANDTCFRLSGNYRRAHPHFGDFQLVLGTLHALQDAAGMPRSQLTDTDLDAAPPLPHVLDIPGDKINSLCNKYSDKIVKKMNEHIQGLQSFISQIDTEDEIARKQVREELKKFSPYLDTVVREIMTKHFTPKDGPFYRMRIYGEPFLPNKDVMGPFMARFRPVHVGRSTRMYNMIRFSVPPAQYHGLIAMNGTVLNGAKLMIRSSDIPVYKVSPDLHGDEDIPEEDEEDDAWEE